MQRFFKYACIFCCAIGFGSSEAMRLSPGKGAATLAGASALAAAILFTLAWRHESRRTKR